MALPFTCFWFLEVVELVSSLFCTSKWCPWQNHLYNQLLFSMKCLLSWVVCVLLGQLQIAWHSKKSERATNTWRENLTLHVLHSFGKGETVLYSTFEQCLMWETLGLLKPPSKCCNTIFSSAFYSKRSENAASIPLLWKSFECQARMKESSET